MSGPTDANGLTAVRYPPGHHPLSLRGSWSSVLPNEVELAPGETVHVEVRGSPRLTPGHAVFVVRNSQRAPVHERVQSALDRMSNDRKKT